MIFDALRRTHLSRLAAATKAAVEAEDWERACELMACHVKIGNRIMWVLFWGLMLSLVTIFALLMLRLVQCLP